MIATPEGKLARYFYGIDYAPKDLKFGIMESAAEQGRQSGRTVVALLLSLRSGDRKIRFGDFDGDAARRRC